MFLVSPLKEINYNRHFTRCKNIVGCIKLIQKSSIKKQCYGGLYQNHYNLRIEKRFESTHLSLEVFCEKCFKQTVNFNPTGRFI